MNTRLKKIAAITTLPLCLLASAEVLAATERDGQEKPDTREVGANGEGKPSTPGEATALLDRQDIRDAWVLGKIETAFTLNRHLNPFAIKTRVNDGIATLSGEVRSEIDRELAEELARSIEGVAQVENKLRVAPDSAGEASAEPNWQQQVSDMTTTAVVKAKLLANGSTKGLDIRVRTSGDIVVLEGDVSSSEEKELAALIASNTDGVAEVENRLRVSGS